MTGYDVIAACASCGSEPTSRTRRDWCNGCYLRWLDAGRPADGPPPRRLWTAESLRAEAELLADSAGLSRAEIAGRLGLSKSAIDAAYSRTARRALRERATA
jgi:hypothetical protein